MSFNTALVAGDYTKLRRLRWQGSSYVSPCDNVVAFAARVGSNLNAIGGQSTNTVPYNTVTVGAYTNLDEGMTVILSPSSDIRNPLAVRLHVAYQVADATNVYVSEFSDPISVNAYIFVLYHYDIIDNLSRPVGINPTVQYIQYNKPFERMAPFVSGLQTGYADWVNASGNYDIAFAAVGHAAESGRTISSYSYTVRATTGGTASVIAGSAATANVTYRFTYGEYWVKLIVTDSGGITTFRHMLVKAHDRTHYPPNTGFDGVEIAREVTGGPSARVKTYTGITSLLNGTMVIVWVDEQYSDPDFSNASDSLINNIDFVGWIESEENMFQTDPRYSAYKECAFEFQGVGARLARLEGQLLALTNNATPTLWDQIVNMTPWRCVVHFLQRHTTVLNLCDFNADDLTDAFKFPILTTIAGRALDNVTGNQGVAELINAQLEFANDGRMQMIRKEPFLASSLSHTPIVVATWQGQDLAAEFKYKFSHFIQYGYVAADGAVWDGTAPSVTPSRSRAPGLAQSSGPDQGKLSNQVLASTTSQLTAQGELNGRSGTEYAMLNNTAELTISHKDGYHWLIPSYGQVYVWDLGVTFNLRNIVLDSGTHWMLKRLTVRHEHSRGTRDVQAVYIPVLAGTPGMTVPIINENSVDPYDPIIPDFPAFPELELPETVIPDAGLPPTPRGSPVDHYGNCVLEINTTGTRLSITKNFIRLAAPIWQDVTPTLPIGYLLIDACFDQLNATGGKTPVYVLANDGTNSIVLHTFDALGNKPWTTGASTNGVYTLVRAAMTLGSVLIYRPVGDNTWVQSFDFTASNGGWTGINVPGAPDYGNTTTYVAATGWRGDLYRESVNGASQSVSHIRYTFGGSTTITAISAAGYGPTNSDYGGGVGFYYDGTLHEIGWSTPYNKSDPSPLACTVLDVHVGRGNSDVAQTLNAPIFITFVTIAGTGTNPFTGSSDAVRVAYSADYGATWSTIQSVGGQPSNNIGGFDVQRAGGVQVATLDHAVKKATSLGGAFSALASFASDQVTDVVLPYYRVGSNTTAQTTSSTPDVLVGLNGVATGGSCIAYINSAGAITYITQPVAGATVPSPDCLTMLRGRKIAGIFLVGGVRKLYVSENLAVDGSATWAFVRNLDADATLRSRRGDPRNASHKGQCFIFGTNSYYTSRWANAGVFVRTSPPTTIAVGDVLG